MSSKSSIHLEDSPIAGDWSVHIYQEGFDNNRVFVEIETKDGLDLVIPLEPRRERIKVDSSIKEKPLIEEVKEN